MAFERIATIMIRRTTLVVCLFFLLVVIVPVRTLDNNYEIIEEEPMSINLIEKANAAFLCKSDGYFADVAYGCQFYHVCENANNPYDKPSFVKHTFSCVNGTVFNQMSFTCTRYDDSIPCEASPNYFYLNERNGNPKALFLTDEDIVVPTKPTPIPISDPPSAHSSMQPFPFSQDDLIFSRNNHKNENHNLKNFKFKDFTETMNIMDLERTKNHNRISSNHLSNSYDPVDDENDEIYEFNTVEHRSSPIITKSEPIQSMNHRSSARISAPYDMTPKLPPFSPISDSIMQFPAGAKYEPATKINTYVPLNSNGFERIATSRPSPGEKMIFGSNLERFSSSSSASPKSDNDIRRPNEILKNTYVSYSDGPLNGETSAHSPVDTATPAPTRKTTFTPAAFSKMYIESQKAAKMERFLQQSQFERAGFSPVASRKPPLLKAFDHVKQEVIPIQNTRPTTGYSPENIRNQPEPAPMSKYDQLPDRFESHINTNNQYVVPSPIRIIDPPTINGRLNDINNNNNNNNKDPETQIVPDQNDGRAIVEQPMKISFIGENPNFGPVKHQPQDDEQQTPGPFVDYGPGEYKVVKQVKGKNLLIDPSLENDPARDNIIAQVLEMLSKYN